MQIGMIGLGRMGAAMTRRLMADGHRCVVSNLDPAPVAELVAEGATGAESLAALVEALDGPRVVWIMVPAAAVESVLRELVPLLQSGDVVIDGGNSYYRDDLRRSADLAPGGISYLDVGTSGGVHGRERGYCLMIGGDDAAFRLAEPIFATLAPGTGGAPRTAGLDGEPSQAEHGYLHCGPSGAGHFVKMVHNGIEYGLMAAYAEGFNLLHHAGVGVHPVDADAETAPLGDPAAYRYDLDLASIAELWRRGSVIPSWLLDLTAESLHASPQLDEYAGVVSDSGEGRWTVQAAVDTGVPAPVLSAALFSRFSSRGNDLMANRVLSAMRAGFGGHAERREHGR